MYGVSRFVRNGPRGQSRLDKWTRRAKQAFRIANQVYSAIPPPTRKRILDASNEYINSYTSKRIRPGNHHFTPPSSQQNTISQAMPSHYSKSGGGPAPISSSSKHKVSKRIPANKGIMRRLECIQKVQDLQCVYVGHTTLALNSTIQAVCRAVIKALWFKEGITAVDGTSTGPGVSSVITIGHYTTPTSFAPTESSTVSIAANSSLDTYVNVMADMLYAVILAADRKYEFTTLNWVGGTTFKHSCHMNTTKITCNIHSVLTFQNTTANAVGTDTVDINNSNPLRIKTYAGPGNGSHFIARSTSQSVPGTYKSFIGGTEYGEISVAAAQVSGRFLDEPPPTKLFKHAHGGRSFILQPGGVHKDTLSSSFTMTLAGYINMHYGLDPNQSWWVPKGHFTFFACEKVITAGIGSLAVPTASNVPVDVDMEIDFKQHVVCTLRSHEIVVPQNLTQAVLPTVYQP